MRQDDIEVHAVVGDMAEVHHAQMWVLFFKHRQRRSTEGHRAPQGARPFAESMAQLPQRAGGAKHCVDDGAALELSLQEAIEHFLQGSVPPVLAATKPPMNGLAPRSIGNHNTCASSCVLSS